LIGFVPESPRWLATKGREDELRKTLARLAGNGATVDSEEVVEQANTLLHVAKHEAELEAESTWKEMFQNGELGTFRRLFVSHQLPLARETSFLTLLFRQMAGSVGLIQQCTGVNVIVYYSPVIFENSIGLSSRLSCTSFVYQQACRLLSFQYRYHVGNRLDPHDGRNSGSCTGMADSFILIVFRHLPMDTSLLKVSADVAQ
jgi:hypothetical protein